MSKRIEIGGASGRSYSFFPLEADAFLKPIGVTYVVAEPGAQGWRVLDVGQTNNLAQRDWEPGLEAIRKANPKAQMLVRLNVSRSIREAEATDITEALAPKA